MKYLKTALIFLMMLCSFKPKAQGEKVYESYDWEKNPVLSTVAEQDKQVDYYYIAEKHILQYHYDGGNELQLYETWHIRIHINSEKGVEQRNKIYISTGRVIETIEIKARCINAAGKVINLAKSEIKSVDDLEGQGPYSFFALQGVEPGCDIEYLYTLKKNARINGTYNIETGAPRKKVDIEFISPDNLIFDLKTYNMDKQFEKDTASKSFNRQTLHLENVRMYKDEKYSTDEANRQRYDFQLRVNTYKSKARMYTWNLISKDVIKNYEVTESDDIKAISKIIAKSGAEKASSDEAKIRAFETYFKKNYMLVEIEQKNLTITKLLQNKIITEFEMNQVFVEAGNQLKVPCEMVFTGNKYETGFDPDFETVQGLKEFLLYYPTIGKYHTPANMYSRLGFPPYQSTGIKGLFIKTTEVAGVKAPIAKCKLIPVSTASANCNNINATISFNTAFLPQAQLENIMLGYSAYYQQPVYELLNDEKKKESAEVHLKLSGDAAVIKDKSILNSAAEDILVKPFIIKGTVELPHLVEKAGDKVIFKVGQIIGPQEEMYEEKERRSDIEMDYPHTLDRTIQIIIPQGYKISNLNDINIDASMNTVNNEEAAIFKSSYTLQGNTLTITIVERYYHISHPKSKINELRKVINASADFNKVSLVFEKS